MDDQEMSQGEQVVFTLRTHPKVLVPPAAALVLLSAAAVAVGTFVSSEGAAGWIRLFSWLLLVLLGITWVLRPVLAWRSTVFTVTTERIMRRRGVLMRRGLDMPLGRVANIVTERGLLDRIFGCGTLLVHDASSTRGLAMVDVPRVLQVREVLSTLIHAATTGTPVPAHLLGDDEGASEGEQGEGFSPDSDE